MGRRNNRGMTGLALSRTMIGTAVEVLHVAYQLRRVLI